MRERKRLKKAQTNQANDSQLRERSTNPNKRRLKSIFYLIQKEI